MSNLSPNLEQLVRASKNAGLPSDADAARLFEALRVRIGDAVLTGAGSTQPTATSMASSSGFALGRAALVSIGSVALLGGVLTALALHPKQVSSTQDVPRASAVDGALAAPSVVPPSEGLATSPEETQAAAVAVSSAEADKSEARAVPSVRAKDKLAEEVALLARAEKALRGGNPSLALDVLNEHERKFGKGILAEERIATRIQALCALGRQTEANAQLAQLSPKSLHGDQSPNACGTRKKN